MTPERWVALSVAVMLLAGCWKVGSHSLARGDGLITAETVFLAAWGVVLGLFAIPWVRFTPTSLTAWIAIYGSIAAFLVGCLFARKMLGRHEGERPQPAETFNPRRFGITWLVLFTLGMVGFAAFVNAINAAIGWQTLIHNPVTTRALQSTSDVFKSEYGSWKLLTYFNQIAFLLWTIGLRGRLFTGRWRFAWAIGWLSLVPYVFTGDRTLILTSLTWAVLFQLLWRPPAHPKRLAVIVGVVGMLLVGVFVGLGARAGKSLSKFPDIAAQLTTPGPQSLALPYVYLTANIPTFSQLTADPIRPHTDGKLTVLPFVKILHRLGIGGIPPEQVGSFYPIPFETFNNYSWLGNIYMDFGLIGCLVIPLLFGFLACWLVLLALRRGSLLSIWVGSLALFVVAYTPMINKLASTLIWQYAIVGPFVLLAVRDNPGPREYLARLAERARSLPTAWKALIAGGSAVALAAILVGAFTSRHARAVQPSPQQQLARANTLAVKTMKDGLYPTSFALSTRLRAALPGATFQEVCSRSGAPLAPGVIGVFTYKSRLRLTTRLAGGSILATSPAGVDLSRNNLDLAIRLPAGEIGLIPAYKGETGRAFATLPMPSLPPQGTEVTVSFRSTRPDIVGFAAPYMLLRFANGPGFQHCSDAAERATPPPFFKIPMKKLDGASQSGIPLSQYSATTITGAPGLVRIDLLAESPEAARAIDASVQGTFRVAIKTPRGSR